MKRSASSSESVPAAKAVKFDPSFTILNHANGRFGTELGPEEWRFSWTDASLNPLAELFKAPRIFSPDCEAHDCDCPASIVSAILRDEEGECYEFKDGWYCLEPRETWVEEPVCGGCITKYGSTLTLELHGHQTKMTVPRGLRIDAGKIPATKPDHVRDHNGEELEDPEPEIPDLFKYTVKNEDAKVVGTMVIELDDCLDEHFMDLLYSLHTQQKERAEFTDDHQTAVDVLECIRTQDKGAASEFVGPHLKNIGAEVDNDGIVQDWGDFIADYVHRDDPSWMAKTLLSWEYSHQIEDD